MLITLKTRNGESVSKRRLGSKIRAVTQAFHITVRNKEATGAIHPEWKIRQKSVSDGRYTSVMLVAKIDGGHATKVRFPQKGKTMTLRFGHHRRA